MRRLLCIPVIVIQAAFAFGQAETPTPEDEAQQHLYDALNGHNVQGRLYPDSWSDSEQYTAVSIPVADGVLQLGALKSAYPTISKSAFVLIQGEDQTDKEVARVLNQFIFILYSGFDQKGYPLTSLIGNYYDYAPSWTFVDAFGRPMAGASIEAQAEHAIMPYKATLDDKGQAPRRMGRPFTIKIEHPDYGAAIVEYMDGDHPSGIYVLPLAPRNSQKLSLFAQGNVVDNNGKPVPDALIECPRLIWSDGNDVYPSVLRSRVVTDANGQFTICSPMMTEELELQGLPPAGTRYYLEIEPPLASNLRQAGKDTPIVIQAGTKQTVVLTAMDAQEYFHTFSFEYAEGPVTSLDELKNIRLTLMRDDRPWRQLRYEQWKDGVALPQGVLQATSARWGEHFKFADVVLTTDSPTAIVVKAPKPIIYRGRVVDGHTGEPMPGVFVETYRTYSPADPPSQTNDWWRQLRDWAARETAAASPQLLYQDSNRAIVTDANGVFQFTFVSGLGWSSYMSYFSATVSDGRTGRIDSFPMRRGHDGAIDVGTIKLLRPEDKTHQFPTMIFHDEEGPVTDPNRLKAVTIEIRTPGRTMMGVRPYDEPSEEREFMAGTYYAEAEWDRKLYTFEPVEVNDPSTVFTFRPNRIEKADVIYTGRVVHAITGQPVASVVILRAEGTPEYDPACLTSEQWAAIRALGPRIDPAHPALAPIKSIFARPGEDTWQKIIHVTQSDEDGRFTLPVKRDLESSWNSLLAVAPDFLGLEQSLEFTVFPEGRGFDGRERRWLEPDANGVANVPLMKLVPAAKVLIHPVVSDPGYGNGIQDVWFDWTSPPGAKPPWKDDFMARPPGTPDISLFYTRSLQPNATQSLYVPADAKLTLTMSSRELTLAPAYLGTVTLKQGQVLDLGRVKFPPGVRVVVKVVDNKGNLAPDAYVACIFESGFQRTLIHPRLGTGSVTVSLPAHSAGKFRVTDFNRRGPIYAEDDVPYQVGGAEDAGKEFVLQLPDDSRRQPPKSTGETASPASQRR